MQGRLDVGFVQRPFRATLQWRLVCHIRPLVELTSFGRSDLHFDTCQHHCNAEPVNERGCKEQAPLVTLRHHDRYRLWSMMMMASNAAAPIKSSSQ